MAQPTATPPRPSSPSTIERALRSVSPDSDDELRQRQRAPPPPPKTQWAWLNTAASGFKPSLELKNVGSVARDHLASERTWLAYVRTSLAIASTGVALVQLFTVAATESDDTSEGRARFNDRLQRIARPLGATVIGLGLVVLVTSLTPAPGIWRFFLIQHTLTKGKFPAARRVVTILSSILAVLIAIVFAVLIGVSH
ncbi:hypothetical protein AURDEDRAFT_57791 [Auricularia subglabra TFB-10046 SS5]|nr:hypothetical protein AURDEDRAFT_57791 [Auricularia subglabra TFB-10046 SS5]